MPNGWCRPIPDNVQWQGCLQAAHGNVGDILATLGKNADALTEYRAGLAIAETLIDRHPRSRNFAATARCC